jgi:negative regulator of sigma E activity
MTGSKDIEARLREFRPRRPAPLQEHFELRRSRAPFWIVAAAAAATVLVVVRRDRAPSDRIDSATLGTLTTLALTDPEQFDVALARISRESLPDVGRAGGALEQLAKP